MQVEENETEGPSIREALTSAMGASDEVASDGDGDTGAAAAPTGGTEAGGDVLEPGADASGEADGTDLPASGGARARDATGKFVKGSSTKTAAPKAGATSQAAPEVAAAKPDATPVPATQSGMGTKPPPGWTPAAREHWTKLPPAVQQEVAKRERETSAALNESAGARKFHQDFNQAVQPYAAMIQASGAEPVKVVQSLLQTAHALSYAPAPQKAAVVAHLIKSYGVDLPTLNDILMGQAPQPSAQQSHVDPNQLAAQIRQQVVQDLQRERLQGLTQKNAVEVDAFSQGKEFFDDVREEMADMMEVAARRGVALSLEEAYNRALRLHPEVSGVLEQREKAKQANAIQASTQRARAAASSIRSSPTAAPPGQAQSDSWHGALEAATAAHSGR